MTIVSNYRIITYKDSRRSNPKSLISLNTQEMTLAQWLPDNDSIMEGDCK